MVLSNYDLTEARRSALFRWNLNENVKECDGFDGSAAARWHSYCGGHQQR
jgi:hypothetical protein